MKPAPARYWPLLVFLVLPCCLLWPVLTGKCLVPADLLSDIAPWRNGNPADMVPWNPLRFDGVAQFYPWRLFAARTLQSGYIPLWNPHQFCGTPFLANSQSAVLYPLNILFVILPVARAFGASAILHLFLTGTFLYLFMRRALGVGKQSAVLAAVVWQLSTWQASWLSLPTFLDTSAWLPLALLLAHRLAQTPSARRAAALGGVLGLSLLAGHLQIGLYCVALTIAYAAYRSIAERAGVRAVIGCALLAGLALFLVEAPQLLPTLELSRLSHRAASGPPTLHSFDAYNRLAMPTFNLVTLLVPGFFGEPGQTGSQPGVSNYWGVTNSSQLANYAENACYVGVVGLLLAVVGIIALCRKDRPEHINPARFFVWSAFLALLLALGTWLGAVLYFGLPGFAQTGSPARVLVIFTLSAAVLAGVGLDALTMRQVKARIAATAYCAAVVVIGGGSLAMLMAKNLSATSLLTGLSNDIRLFAGLALAAGAVIALHRRGTLKDRGASALLIALAAVDLLTVNMGYNPCVDQSRIYPVTPAIAWLQAHVQPGDRIMPVNEGRDWSIVSPPSAIFPPNAATVYGLDDLQGYDSLQTAAYKDFASKLDGHDASPDANGNIVFVDKPFTALSEQVGARWIIAASPMAGAPTPVYADGSCVIYEDVKAHDPTSYFGPGGVNRPANVAWVPTDDFPTKDGSVGRVDIEQQEYPGWSYSEIVAAPAHVYDEPFRPAYTTLGPGMVKISVFGEHVMDVKLHFEPTSFRLGLYFGMVAIGLFGAFGAGGVMRRRAA